MSKRGLIYILLLAGFLILFEQYLVYGVWFSLDQIHHETFAVAFAFAATSLYLYSDRRRAKS